MNLIQTAKATGRQLAQFVAKNEPSLLAYSAMGGVVATGLLSVKGGIDYVNESQAYISQDSERSKYEKIGLALKCFWPAFLAGGSTIGLIFASNKTHLSRNAALLALATMKDNDFKRYKESVQKTIGEKKLTQIDDQVIESRLEEANQESSEVEGTGAGDCLCFDPLTGRKFRSSRSAILDAAAFTNNRIMLDNGASLNDFYDELNLANTKLGESVGWDADHPIRIDFTSRVDSQQGVPMLVLKYENEPQWLYR